MDAVQKGLEFIDALPREEQTAFLALFAGARFPWTIYDNGSAPFIGKAECEWIADWRGFYAERLPAAGLFRWIEGESGDALGMVRKADGSYHRWTRIDCGPTELGFDVREAWWDRFNSRPDADTSGTNDQSREEQNPSASPKEVSHGR